MVYILVAIFIAFFLTDLFSMFYVDKEEENRNSFNNCGYHDWSYDNADNVLTCTKCNSRME